MAVEKRFPADMSMDIATFLNDSKINAELYAIFQQCSHPEKKDGVTRTIVKKKDLPTQAKIGVQLGIKSPKTIRAHRDYLIKKGFLVEEFKGCDYYVLPNLEDIFFMIPLNTLQFMNDVFKEQVIKIYIYLGQRWKFKQEEWSFTEKEIAEHIGLTNNTRGYTAVSNALFALKKIGLIDYITFYEKNSDNAPTPKIRLTQFEIEIKR